MPVRQIITLPNNILRAKAQKVKKIDEEILKIAKDLADTVKLATDPEGAGLAAPQIGASKRICVVRNFFVDPQDPEKVLSEDVLLINPRIISTSKETGVDWEGCLSVPNKYGKVERFNRIKVTALGLDGTDIKFKAADFLARTIQHEIDHLDGIIFTDRVIGKVISEEELEKII
jgi:peptide deformylase